MEKEERVNQIALFNLYSIKAEVNRVKQAIQEARLWEYTIKKARSHPKLFESIEAITNNSKNFINTTPKFKEKAVFLFSTVDQVRPEILSFHSYVRNFRTKKKILVISKDTNQKPMFISNEYNKLKKKFKESDTIQFCAYNPFLGIIPVEISDIYPASHYVMASYQKDPNDFPIFEETCKIFFEKNNFEIVYLPKNDDFLKYFRKCFPVKISTKTYQIGEF